MVKNYYFNHAGQNSELVSRLSEQYKLNVIMDGFNIPYTLRHPEARLFLLGSNLFHLLSGGIITDTEWKNGLTYLLIDDHPDIGTVNSSNDVHCANFGHKIIRNPSVKKYVVYGSTKNNRKCLDLSNVAPDVGSKIEVVPLSEIYRFRVADCIQTRDVYVSLDTDSKLSTEQIALLLGQLKENEKMVVSGDMCIHYSNEYSGSLNLDKLMELFGMLHSSLE